MLTQQACSNLYHVALMAPPPSPKYVLILAQHVRDRRAPWRLNDVLAAHLFNHGISTTKSSISVPGRKPALCPLSPRPSLAATATTMNG